jgi:hypothetical protein
MLGEILSGFIFETILGPIVEPVLNRAGPRIAKLATTPVLIATWIIGLGAFGFGCYFLATASDPLRLGIGAAGLLIGLPAALVVSILWRDLQGKRLGKKYVRPPRR